MSPICGIYLITHRDTGRGYVGLSKDIHSRWAAHRCPSSDQQVSKAIKQHGKHAFTFDVLEECSFDLLGDREEHWIEQLETWGPKGFNMNPGGSVVVHTDESKRKTAEALRGVPKTPEHRQKVIDALTGREVSDEQKLKFADAAKRRWQDPEKRAALMASRSKKRVCSDETKQKIAKAISAYMATPEGRAQRSAATSLHLQKPEARQQRREAMSKRMSDPAVRVATGLAVKAYWENKRKETNP